MTPTSSMLGTTPIRCTSTTSISTSSTLQPRYAQCLAIRVTHHAQRGCRSAQLMRSIQDGVPCMCACLCLCSLPITPPRHIRPQPTRHQPPHPQRLCPPAVMARHQSATLGPQQPLQYQMQRPLRHHASPVCLTGSNKHCYRRRLKPMQQVSASHATS